MLILLMDSKHLHTTWHIWFSWLVEFIENTIHSSPTTCFYLPSFTLALMSDNWEARQMGKQNLVYYMIRMIQFHFLNFVILTVSKIRRLPSCIRQQTKAINFCRKLTSLLKANTYQNLVWWHSIKVCRFIPNKLTF